MAGFYTSESPGYSKGWWWGIYKVEWGWVQRVGMGVKMVSVVRISTQKLVYIMFTLRVGASDF